MKRPIIIKTLLLLFVSSACFAQPNYLELETSCKNETKYNEYYKKDPKRVLTDIPLMMVLKAGLENCVLRRLLPTIKNKPEEFCAQKDKNIQSLDCVTEYLSRNTTTGMGVAEDITSIISTLKNSDESKYLVAKNVISLLEDIDVGQFYLSKINPSSPEHAKILKMAKEDEEKNLSKLVQKITPTINQLLQVKTESLIPKVKALQSKFDQIKNKSWKFPE